MSAARFNDDLQPLAPGDRVRAALNVRRQNAVAALAQEAAMGTHFKVGPGMRLKRGADGVTIMQKKSGSRPSSSNPRLGLEVVKHARIIATVPTITFSVVPSTVLYEMPTLNGNALNIVPAPELALTGSGAEHVIVTITGNLPVVGSIFVQPVFSSITSVVISAGVAPTSADMISDSGVFKFLLATFVDGVKTAQVGHGPIIGELCDDLSGSATAQLNLTWTYP